MSNTDVGDGFVRSPVLTSGNVLCDVQHGYRHSGIVRCPALTSSWWSMVQPVSLLADLLTAAHGPEAGGTGKRGNERGWGCGGITRSGCRDQGSGSRLQGSDCTLNRLERSGSSGLGSDLRRERCSEFTLQVLPISALTWRWRASAQGQRRFRRCFATSAARCCRRSTPRATGSLASTRKAGLRVPSMP
eukprot:945420-Rhodomonas_salina.3